MILELVVGLGIGVGLVGLVIRWVYGIKIKDWGPRENKHK